MKLAEFFVDLVVDADTGELKDFGNGVKDISIGLTKMAAIAGTAIFGIKKFTEGSVDSTVAMQNFNNQTDLSIEKLQRWQVAGRLSDLELTSEQITDNIKSLQENLTQIGLGAGNVAPYQLLGISVAGKDAFDVLIELREAIKGLDDATAVNLIKQTGLSPNFINILRTSQEEFDRLVDSADNFLTATERKDLVEFGTEVERITINLGQMIDKINAKFANSFVFMANEYRKFSDTINQDETNIFQRVAGFALKTVGEYTRAAASAVTGVNDFGILDKKFIEILPERTQEVKRQQEVNNQLNNTFNNNYNIQSTASPQEIADYIRDTMQTDLNLTYDELNNGAVY